MPSGGPRRLWARAAGRPALPSTAPPNTAPLSTAHDTLGGMSFHWPLSCPVCQQPAVTSYAEPARADSPDREQRTPGRLSHPSSISCPDGHRFDAARQGYVNLLTGRGTRFTPDSAAMIMARERVLRAGLFDEISAALSDVVADILRDGAARTAEADQVPYVLDVGCGTGNYLHRVLDHHSAALGIGVDLSPAGLKRCARHERTLALGWDVWRQLPLRSSSVDVVLAVFAPRNAEEFARVLTPGGLLLVVTPRPGHLAELRAYGLLGIQPAKSDAVEQALQEHFTLDPVSRRITTTRSADPGIVADAVFMGPAGHHHSHEDIFSRLACEGPHPVTIDVDLSVFKLA